MMLSIEAVTRVVQKRIARGATPAHILAYLESLKKGAWKNNPEYIDALAAEFDDSDIIGKVYFIESPSFEGFAEVLGVNNDDTVRVKSEWSGRIFLVEKVDLTKEA